MVALSTAYLSDIDNLSRKVVQSFIDRTPHSAPPSTYGSHWAPDLDVGAL